MKVELKATSIVQFIVAGCSLAALGLAIGSCAQEPVASPLRSIQSSGPMAFVCLGAPTDDPADFAHKLSDCSAARANSIHDYSIPHLYVLVTQPHAGEIAVVDLTTDSDAVLDQNPAVPGANFLPVGAQPTDIAATPAGMASFVSIAEPNFEGIFALPATMIRGGMPRLSSWPSCSLPSAPGDMVIVIDPADGSGAIRPGCDAPYGQADTTTCGSPATVHCHGDLSKEGDITGQHGRYKLIVTLPDEGGFAVIDAQNVLDREAGQFAPCDVERWIPLDVKLPTWPAQPDAPTIGCVAPPQPEEAFADSFVSRPAGIAVDDRRLYLADAAAPVIHVVDLPTPCEPVQWPSLYPRSTEDPTRVVTTERIAVSPATIDFKRYLYATDLIDGSVMVFDVSDDSTTNTPLERSSPELNPFQPTDRIRFHAPPKDIVIVHYESGAHDGQTGSSIPIRCDPDPNSTGPGTAYRTASSYDSGAAPGLLRGVFAFVVLASGDVVVIDVDDYDAPCRGPVDHHESFGCTDLQTGLVTSGEYSCNTIDPHRPRSGGYLVQVDGVASNVPGLQALPLLYDPEGSILTIDDETDEGKLPPRLRAPAVAGDAPRIELVVAQSYHPLDPATGELLDEGGNIDPTAHTLAMNLQNPRAHIVNQNWWVSWEGAIPGFNERFAELVDNSDGTFTLREVSSAFCNRGVLSQTAVEEMLIAEGYRTKDATAQAPHWADYIQIRSATPIETDSYWSSQNECTFIQCRNEYGTLDSPRVTRDLRIVEAWQDMLALEPRHPSVNPDAPRMKCCFPAVVEFWVRLGNQWLVYGDGVGVLHRVRADPDTGQCRNSCDPNLQLLTPRAFSLPHDAAPSEEHRFVFRNPFFRFVVKHGYGCDADEDCSHAVPERDTHFKYTTQGGFIPLVISLYPSEVEVQPQAAQFLAQTGELVIADGSLEGLTMVDLNSLVVGRQYF